MPAAEATANLLAPNNAAVKSSQTDYIDPACKAVQTVATAVDGTWLGAAVANMSATAAGAKGTATAD